MKMSRKKILIALAVLVLAAGALCAVWLLSSRPGNSDLKDITLVVVDGAGSQTTYGVETHARTLGGALKDARKKNILTYTEKSGMITEIQGIAADWDGKKQWWCLTQNGRMLETGVETTVIADGDSYEFTLTVG